MTKLTKPVKRTVEGIERRPLVVALYPNRTIGLRVAKTRTEFVVTLARVYRLACEVTAEARKKDKEQAREQARRDAGLPPRRRLVSRGLLRP
jgi:hypothetical protein